MLLLLSVPPCLAVMCRRKCASLQRTEITQLLHRRISARQLRTGDNTREPRRSTAAPHPPPRRSFPVAPRTAARTECAATPTRTSSTRSYRADARYLRTRLVGVPARSLPEPALVHVPSKPHTRRPLAGARSRTSHLASSDPFTLRGALRRPCVVSMRQALRTARHAARSNSRPAPAQSSKASRCSSRKASTRSTTHGVPAAFTPMHRIREHRVVFGTRPRRARVPRLPRHASLRF